MSTYRHQPISGPLRRSPGNQRNRTELFKEKGHKRSTEPKGKRKRLKNTTGKEWEAELTEHSREAAVWSRTTGTKQRNLDHTTQPSLTWGNTTQQTGHNMNTIIQYRI
jgi:hypothetical protein